MNLSYFTLSAILIQNLSNFYSETLDDQDAAEAAAVQNKLEDLQQARRDFVMAVANVGGNAVNIADETPPDFGSFLDHSPPFHPTPPSRQIYR